MGEIGIKELLLIAIVILLLFGTKKLPELMRGLGKGLKTFNDGKQSIMDEVDGIKNPIATAKKQVITKVKSSITDLDHEAVAKSSDDAK
ncbi:MAG TPA: twin-arginine translocase TatA/TatE family subunit [Arachidicoccus sp.]|nr:twin-arginine translocase TatA/TatE family subunit [Arachidicoccus sp.]